MGNGPVVSKLSMAQAIMQAAFTRFKCVPTKENQAAFVDAAMEAMRIALFDAPEPNIEEN
jgi:hypothetical protein